MTPEQLDALIFKSQTELAGIKDLVARMFDDMAELRTALAASEARVAGMREAAKNAISDICPHADVPGGNFTPNTFDEGTSAAFEAVADLTDADADAALAARDKRVREEATSDKAIAAAWAHYGDLSSAKAAVRALIEDTQP